MTRILHLEDSPRDAEQVQDALQRAGIDCDLEVVSDGVEFERALAGSHFDLILSDYDLPGYDGLAALVFAREKRPDVPFIMVSGAMGEEAAIDTMVRGATDYVLKQRLSRLGPAVLRALAEGRERQVLRKAETDLRRMATVVRDSNDAITIQNFEGGILAWNRGAELMYGYGEAEALEKNIDLLTAPGKVAEQKAFIRRLVAGEDVTSFETQRVTRDGRVLDVWLTVTKLVDNDGKPIGLASTERDITARKREEAASRRNLKRIHAMVELLQRPDASEKELLTSAVERLVEITGSELAFLGTVDPSETTLMANLYSNRAMQECAVDGRSVEFTVATGGLWAEAIRRHQPITVNDFEQANPLKKGTPAGHVGLRRFMGVPSVREGVVLLFAGMANKPEPYDELDLSEATLFVEGLTEAVVRKRFEIAQAESEKRYRGLFDAARDGILIVDADTGKVVDVNPFLMELSGYPREYFLGKSLWEIQTFKNVFDSSSSFTELRESGHAPGVSPSLETRDGRHLDIEFLSNVCPIENRSLLQCNIRDITARRLSEESLKASEQRFMSILLASHDAILLIDGDRFAECNEATVRMLGYANRDEFLMTHPSQLSPPTQPDGRGSLEKADDMMQKALLNGYHRFEWMHRRASGEDFPVEVSLTPINYQGRTLLHCLWRDITEQKQSEAARWQVEEGLKQEQALSKTIIDSIPGTFYMLDETGLYVRWNAYQRDEIVGKPDDMVGSTNALDTIHPDDRELVQSRISNVLANGAVETVEGRVLLRGGPAFRWLVMTGCRVLIDSRPFLVGIGIDITERKQAEAAANAAKSFLDRIIDAIPNPLFVKDDQRRFVLVNDALCAIVGCPRESLVGEDGDDLFPAEQTAVFRKVDAKVLETGVEDVNEESVSNVSTGEVRTIVAHKTLYIDPAGKRFLVGLIQDVTERLRFEAAARQQQKLESIGTLASGVAHEINNPLSVIMNYGEMLLGDPADASLIKDCAENIVKESDRIAVIVRNLLSFARQDKETHSPARIEDIVERTLSLMRAVLRRDQINLQCSLAQDLPMVKCRSQQIQQVLMNLLTNARDALNERYPKGASDKEIRIEAFAFEKDGIRWIRLTVEDHGNGIPADVAGKAFDPFFTTKARDKGTGLGLSISYGIVKEHHGELWFETELGKGTRFHVDLRVNNGWSVQNPGDASSR
ncbi:MAG: PAS domain S-box protein [Myxococcota bacterium]